MRDDPALWLEFIALCDRRGDRPRDVVFDLIAIYLDEVAGRDYVFAPRLADGGGKLC